MAQARLTDAELGALFALAQAGDKEAMEKAMEALESLVVWLCKQFFGKENVLYERQDILQEARAEAVEALLAYDPSSNIGPRAAVLFAVRSRVNTRLFVSGRREARQVSMDAPTGEDSEITLADLDSAFAVNDDLDDVEMLGLLDKVPVGLTWKSKGGNRVVNRLAQTSNSSLPSDDELIKLIEAGHTRSQLAEMFGVGKDAIQYRVRVLRRSGRHVPSLRREERPRSKTLKVPWEEKRQIIADYLERNPGIGLKAAGQALGMAADTVARARRELVAAGGASCERT